MKSLSSKFPTKFLEQFNKKPVLCRFLVGESDSVYMSGIFELNGTIIKLVPIKVDTLSEEVRGSIQLPSLIPVTTYFSSEDLSYIADLFDNNEVDLSV